MPKLSRVLAVFLLFAVLLTGCGSSSAEKGKGEDVRRYIGEESYQNPRSVLLFENVPDVGPAVVYHEVKDVTAFINAADKPVWVFLYHSLDPVFRDLIPFVEQACEAFRGKVYILLLEVDSNKDFEQAWKPRELPFMAVFRNGSTTMTTDQVNRNSLITAKEQLEKWTGTRVHIPGLD